MQVDENMATAHHRNAVLADKFWFRKNLFPPRGAAAASSSSSNRGSPAPTRSASPGPVEDEYGLMTIDEIMNGIPGEQFLGLIPLIESYLNIINVDVVTRCELTGYLRLVSRRASGELQTGATWIRDFVRAHPAYARDSVVSEAINYDLLKAAEALGRQGTLPDGRADKLLGGRR